MTSSLLDRRKAADLRPRKKPKPISQFAGTMRLPDGPMGPKDGQPGMLWSPATEPTQVQYLEEVESGLWNWFIITAPSQVGKTLKAILCPALHSLTELRQPVAYCMPSMDLLQKTWGGKLQPAIEGAGFKEWLPTKGPGSKGGRPAVLTLREPSTGMVAARMYLTAMGTGERETATANVTAQTILLDEADDVSDAGKLRNVCKRINSYGREGRAFCASTVNGATSRVPLDPQDPASAHPILVFMKEGSQHRAHHQCRHCSGYFVPDLEHLDIERESITCPLCSVIWSEEDRRHGINSLLMCGVDDRIENGRKIRGTPRNSIYSELTTCLDYHMTDLQSVCEDMRMAKRKEAFDQTLMCTAMHKLWCRPYVAPRGAIEITNKGLAEISRLSDYDKRVVPHWVTHLTAAVDVQGDRIYWLVAGIGPDDRWCIVDWGYEFFVPTEKGQQPSRAPTASDRRRVYSEMDARFNAGWTKEGGSQVMCPLPGLRGIDVGDGEMVAEITGWLRGVPGWRAVRGAHRDTLRNLGKIVELPPEAKAFVELRQPDGWPIHLCNVMVDTVRRWCHASLLRPPYSEGSGMLPRGLDAKEALLLHLSGKVWVDPQEKGGKYIEGYWNDKAHPRHDWLDCLTYAIALSRFRTGLQTVAAQRRPVKYGRIGSVGVRR